MRPATAQTLGVLFVTAQLLIPLTRLRLDAPYPLSGRFAWTMFAGPLVAIIIRRAMQRPSRDLMGSYKTLGAPAQ